MFPVQNTIPGNDLSYYGDQQTALVSVLEFDKAAGRLPQTFPILQWTEQSSRYDWYWSWQRGDVLDEVLGKTKEGRTVYRYPLHINPVRNFARKHAALLFGEVPDTPEPLVKETVRPKGIYNDPSDALKTQAKFCADVVNEVWTSSKGRSIQLENGQLSQFLGGSVFQVCYQPWRTDLLIPITIKNIYANFFLPIWNPDDYYDLLECWVVYRVTAATAQSMWGINPQKDAITVLYAEHWTKTYYEVFVDGHPLVATMPNGMVVDYTHPDNVFGIVPFVYIPRMREGSFYGSSFVPDVSGLALEFNARTADEGDAMRRTAAQRFVGSNITGEPTIRKLDDRGNTFIDIGVTNPALDDPPKLDPLEPPKWNQSYSDLKDFLWEQIQREGGMGPIAFGEDEGSQRSALTLAFRMWPSTVVAKAQRTTWTDGLNQVARYILIIAAIKKIQINSQRVPMDFNKLFDFAPDWLPMIPRDREAQVNEIILRLQAGAISIEKALEDFGDVPDIDEEVERIRNWLTFMAQVAAAEKSTGQGAQQDIVTPVASSGLRDQ